MGACVVPADPHTYRAPRLVLVTGEMILLDLPVEGAFSHPKKFRRFFRWPSVARRAL